MVGYVYILTNKANKVMYIGVTTHLERRIMEHRQGMIGGFTSRYKVNKLVYVESLPTISEAIAREKQLKGWRREKRMRC